MANAPNEKPDWRPRLGVVVPMANEEKTVSEFLTRLRAHLGPNDRVFCVIDRVTVDATRQQVAAFSRADPRLQEVWAPENRCVVDAYVRGYEAALADGCEWILEMDAGFSHLPEEIPRLLAAMDQGADFAAGSRFVTGGSYDGRWLRWIYSRWGSWLINALLRTEMHDMTSGFQCFRRSTLQHVLAQGIRSRQHFFQAEIRAMMHGWNWQEIPITYANPTGTPNRAAIVESFRNLIGLYRTRKSLRYA